MKVEVDSKYLKMLEKDSEMMQCLDACGVCDWEGYSEAQEMYDQESGTPDGEEY